MMGFWAKSVFPLMGKRLHIEGQQHIRKGERYILLANHASMFDIIAIMAFYPNVSWFGHERSLRIPLFKQMLLMTDYIPMRMNTVTNTRRMLEGPQLAHFSDRDIMERISTVIDSAAIDED